MKIKTTLIVAAIILVIIIIGLLYTTLNKNTEENSSSPLTYILKKHNNTIAIFIEGEELPYEVLDVPFNNLPFEDKELLTKGIRSNSLSEIIKQAEDYDG